MGIVDDGVRATGASRARVLKQLARGLFMTVALNRCHYRLSAHAWFHITDEQVDGLRHVGWSDEQIAEAVYDGALFNLFVRLADAFDIHPQARYDAAGVPAVVVSP